MLSQPKEVIISGLIWLLNAYWPQPYLHIYKFIIIIVTSGKLSAANGNLQVKSCSFGTTVDYSFVAGVHPPEI